MTTPMASAPKQLETKYTPGPWHTHQYVGNDDSWYVRGPKQETVCGHGAGPVREHDARLIAAAPEMAEMLRRVLDRGYISSCIEEERGDHAAIEALLAKIGGDV